MTTQAVRFWQARESLCRIEQFARARRAGPWGTLGVVLLRGVATVPPTVWLPPSVGGRVSLNLFAALVGESGAGKGACEAAARDAVAFFYDRTGHIPVEVPSFPIGSGEGIARTFRPAGWEEDKPNKLDRALFCVPEIDTLSALMGRAGATLEGEVRKLYSGEAIGFNNAHQLTRSVVAEHSYRACLVAGVQPLRAGALLSGADGGTPQRFLWFPVTDPDAPDTAPDEPECLRVHLPQWAPGPLTIPDAAAHTIDQARVARLRGETGGAAELDGHALLTRLKVAAALMVLEGRTVVSIEDWELAAAVLAVSDACRGRVQRATIEQARRSNRARALATAEREEFGDARKMQLTREGILRWLDRLGETRPGALRRRLKDSYRGYFYEAAAQLLADGLIINVGTENAPIYRPAPKVLEHPGTHTKKAASTSADTVSTPGTRAPAAPSAAANARIPEHPGAHISKPVSASADEVSTPGTQLPPANTVVDVCRVPGCGQHLLFPAPGETLCPRRDAAHDTARTAAGAGH
ncbi:hypothetical protein ACQP0C_02520 [Nocardia sp. CA-129566]|uniref:hypothetical protein n=1 Tax=Nocardia sp. CA-129566 TaxID=3239976 RepID=UPI003D97CF25